MKRIVSIIVMLVLTLSLAAAAFAAGSSTSVTVEVDSSNISVTVPLTLSITAKVDGGEATVPSDYKITNNSAVPVRVDTIAVTLNDSTNWAFKNDAIAANTAPTTTGVNDIYLSVNGQTLAEQAAIAPASPNSWNIPASSNLELPLVCSTSRLNQTDAATNLITITYVISAGRYNPK